LNVEFYHGVTIYHNAIVGEPRTYRLSTGRVCKCDVKEACLLKKRL